MSRVTRVSLIALLAGAALAVRIADALPLPTNNDPSNQIRFSTPAQADAKRQQLINFIWAGGLPMDMLPTVTSNVGSSVFSGNLNGISPSLVSQVTRLDANVSGYDFLSTSYLLTPTNTAHSNNVVIVHQGHSSYGSQFNSGVGRTVNALLLQGFMVDVMQMPLFGWNTDNTAIVPGQGTLTYGSHGVMIANTGPAQGGTGFRLFLEPVIQDINYFETLPTLREISMVGISGGGWTTEMAAAIDPRISLSIPVAGSAPLYYRNSNPSSVGDLEQYYEPLYAEDIAPDGTGGGVATWLEIYALGGYGTGREQIMVTNQFDSCCFSGTFADMFKTIVSDTVSIELGQGEWDYYLDSTSSGHEIGLGTLNRVIFPALDLALFPNEFDPSGVPEPSSIALLLAGLAWPMLFNRFRGARSARVTSQRSLHLAK